MAHEFFANWTAGLRFIEERVNSVKLTSEKNKSSRVCFKGNVWTETGDGILHYPFLISSCKLKVAGWDDANEFKINRLNEESL